MTLKAVKARSGGGLKQNKQSSSFKNCKQRVCAHISMEDCFFDRCDKYFHFE